MQKLVVLKLDGDLVEGVRVTLEIGAEGDRAAMEVRGDLPPNPEIVTHYQRWQSTYRSLEDFRITPIGISIGGSRTEQLNNCRNLGFQLSQQMNSWLNSSSFRPLKEKLLKQLTPDDTVRVLIKTDDIWLRRLPWHLWDFFEDYSKAEVALSALEYEKLFSSKTRASKDRVKILAILGNSEGISIEKDRELLEKLPDAAPTFLVEPQRNQLSEQLWNQDWDILFFAGHSSSQSDGKTGNIYINETDKLTINDLKYALKQAIRGGLQLAIFNSCDGLGLAHQLEGLHIPQLVVMREPVQDKVAQEFLKNFLTKFSGGESLYLAVRQSRERLHSLEDEHPCAIWLPAIFQNPAAVPPTWSDLLKKPEPKIETAQPTRHKSQQESKWRSFQIVLLASVFVTSLVIGVRSLGLLQSWELLAFDQLMGLRPHEEPDPRLLLVTVTEKDVQNQNPQERRGSSLSDSALVKLLEKLQPYQPRAIGLDIYHDFPADPNYADLQTHLQQNKRFIAVCEVGGTDDYPGIKPPPGMPNSRYSFSDFPVDPDGVIRRQLLAMAPNPTSVCTTDTSFSFQVARTYLAAKDIHSKRTPEGDLQIGSVVFKKLGPHTGGYHQLDALGYQVLLNYRSSNLVAEQITLTKILSDSINAELPNLVKDRIVLIGTTAKSFKDYFPIPNSAGQWPHEMPGVVVQAHMVSQILSAVLDQRPLLWWWPDWGETFWIWGWSVVGGVLVWYFRGLPVHLTLISGTALGTLYGLCFIFLLKGGWIPLVPSALALAVTGGSIVAYAEFQTKQL